MDRKSKLYLGGSLVGFGVLYLIYSSYRKKKLFKIIKEAIGGAGGGSLSTYDEWFSPLYHKNFVDYIVFPPIDLGTVSLKDNFTDIKLFPNPTMGSFEITFSDNKSHTALIYDVNGKLIYLEKSLENIKFDISEKSAGTYTIKIMPEGITYQIVKN